MREQFITVDKDDVIVILEWDGVNPQYLVNVNITVIPEVQVNISRNAAQLKVTYNVMYNVSVANDISSLWTKQYDRFF